MGLIIFVMFCLWGYSVVELVRDYDGLEMLCSVIAVTVLYAILIGLAYATTKKNDS